MGSRTGRKPWRSEPLTPENDEARAVRTKIFYFGLLVVVMFGILTLQLARLQLVNGDEYALRAETNRLRQEPILPARGLIYDRNGIPLVENQASFAAAVVPADVPKGQLTAISLALQDLTGVPAGEIEELIAERAVSIDPYSPVVVKENLAVEAAFAIRERLAWLPGVRVIVEPLRYYREGELLSHILGFVGPLDAEEYALLKERGYNFADRIGKAGVENTYEAVLRGQAGARLVEADASGREIQVLGEVPAVPGRNVVLSIDVELQRSVEQLLRAGMGRSRNAVAIVMDVNNGDILALVSLPNYDSNIFSGEVDQAALMRLLEDPAKPMLNHAISEMYAPGSTFKMVTGLAALQEGVATAGTQIFSPGYLDVENQYLPGVFDRFRDWTTGLGTMNFYRGVAMSSDVYFYYLSGGYVRDGVRVFQGLGADRLASWARRFGLGERTGIDLPGETPGIVPDPAWKEATIGEGWLLGDTYNFGIGQGYVATTPLQMVLVTAAVANGGNVLVPHVVKGLTDANGQPVELRRQAVKRNLNIDPRNMNVMREALRQAVADGTGNTAAVRNVSVAGKTGTAEFGELIAPNQYREHGWFTGYAPFQNPEIAVVVFVELGGGASTAAPIAGRIFDYYFNQLKVARGGQ